MGVRMRVALERNSTAPPRSSSQGRVPVPVWRRASLVTQPEFRHLQCLPLADAILGMQATLGNRVVARMLGEGPPVPAVTHVHEGSGSQLVQRCGDGPCACEHDEKRSSTLVSRHAEPSAAVASGVPESVSNTLRSPGQPLEPTVHWEMSRRFGHDFSSVRVHADAGANRSAADINARAYTAGFHVVFRAGEYQPSTPSGRQLLAHELIHVLQQRHSIPAGPLVLGDLHSPAEAEAERVAMAGSSRTIAKELTGRTGGPAVIRRQGAPPRPPGAGLLPPGDCTPAEHLMLQNEVDRACDRDTRCTQNDDCATLWQKITFNTECIRARAVINARCFRGGNLGHIIALANAVNGLIRCWLVYNRQCQPQAPPLPAPERAPEPERRPVVDKSFMDRMAEITGLTGTALIAYLIVSEGSRLFPPRNLVPVP
jgi:Domain of unknown function (DUF4157)/Novel toxin 16